MSQNYCTILTQNTNAGTANAKDLICKCKYNGVHKVKNYVHFLLCSLSMFSFTQKCKVFSFTQQECIPVGCVPAARRPYAGVCFPGGGVCLVQGGCLPGLGEGGVCLVQGGLPGPGGWGCLPGLGGLPGWGGVCLVRGSAWSGGVCLVRGVGIPACIEAEPPPCEQNDKQV